MKSILSLAPFTLRSVNISQWLLYSLIDSFREAEWKQHGLSSLMGIGTYNWGHFYQVIQG